MNSSSQHRFTSQRAWIVSAGRVLASAELALSRRERRTGLIGRVDLDGAYVIDRCRWIHTIGVKFPLDIAYLDDEGTVIKIVAMPRWRIGVPVQQARTVVEARAGAFDRWGLRSGDTIEIRPADRDDS